MSSIDAVRAAVGIDAVLGEHGYPSVGKGRMACPLHHGRNPSCFSVRNNEYFRCFNCDAHGDVIDLERALGGGTNADSIRRLCERHGIQAGHVDLAADRRRRGRLRRVNEWWTQRSNDWTTALVKAEVAARAWQCDPADADAVFWAELDRRCTARDRAEAMVETFRELRTIEQRVNAFIVEQRGAVWRPEEALWLAG